jgi:hypothetical protein
LNNTISKIPKNLKCTELNIGGCNTISYENIVNAEKYISLVNVNIENKHI